MINDREARIVVVDLKAAAGIIANLNLSRAHNLSLAKLRA